MSSSRVLVVPLALVAASLVGCSFSANLTVAASSVAEGAEDALEAEIGQRPAIDCGDEDVPLVDDTEVECELLDEATGTTFDTVVTISGVDGADYRIDVQVADVPTAGADEVPEPEAPADSEEDAATEPDAPAAGEVLSAYDYEVAEVAAGALEAELGAAPTVLCEGDETNRVAIKDGVTVDCTVIDATTGTRYEAVATISDVVGTDYVVKIALGSTL